MSAAPAVCSILPERQATPPAVCASRGPGAFYSLAAQSAQARETPTPGGSECIPATLSAFLDAWISPIPKAARIDYGPQYNGVGECPF